RYAYRHLHLTYGIPSHVLGIHDAAALVLLHLVRPLAPDRSYRHLTGPPFTGFSNRLAEPIALECPTPASGDYRIPGLVVEQPDGSTVLELAYAGHRITPGKPALDGLPATYVESNDEAETVEVDLRDARSGIVATLSSPIFLELPVNHLI